MFLPKFYIFRRWKEHIDYLQQCKPKTKMAMQTKTWMTNFIFKKLLSFFKKLIPCGISLNNRHLLMLNGHGSHVTLKVIERTQKLWLDMIILPLHTSHVFQPLNVAYFNKPPNSSMESTMSPNHENNKRIMSWTHSSVRDILKVEGRVGVLGWRLVRMTNKSITRMDLHQKKKSWLMSNWNIFCAQTNTNS